MFRMNGSMPQFCFCEPGTFTTTSDRNCPEGCCLSGPNMSQANSDIFVSVTSLKIRMSTRVTLDMCIQILVRIARHGSSSLLWEFVEGSISLGQSKVPLGRTRLRGTVLCKMKRSLPGQVGVVGLAFDQHEVCVGARAQEHDR